MKTRLRYFFFVTVLLAAGARQAQAATITVDETTCTLADAITAANNNADAGCCTGSGTYGDDIILLEINVTLAVSLPEITSTVIIEGQGRTIDGNDDSAVGSVLRISADGDLTLNEVTITGGNTSGYGGGINNYNGGTITLTSSMVSGNSADCGGGIENYNGGTITLTDSTVSGNTAVGYGGGIESWPSDSTVSSTVTLINSTVSDNSAGYYGGGLYNEGIVTLTSSTVSGNTSDGDGGGIGNYGGTVTLTNSTVSGNTAVGYAGGIDNWNDGTITLTNSTVSGNSAAYDGGGIENSATVTLTSSTVSGNSAGNIGGGIDNYSGGTVTWGRSIVSGNTAGSSGDEVYNEIGSIITADSYNLFGDSGKSSADAFYIFAPSGSDVTATSDGTDPTALSAILNPLTNNGGPTETHALVTGSPAVDLDTACTGGLSTDQRGEPRPLGAGCDAGSFEGSISPPGTGGNTAFLPAVYLLLLNK